MEYFILVSLNECLDGIIFNKAHKYIKCLNTLIPPIASQIQQLEGFQYKCICNCTIIHLNSSIQKE